MCYKEQETSPTLQEHDDDDDKMCYNIFPHYFSFLSRIHLLLYPLTQLVL